MASISSAKLSIKVTTGSVSPTVTYRLSFSQGDLNLMQQYPGLYRLRCELWGADSGLNGGDDKIYIYPTVKLYPDGSLSAAEEGSFTATMPKGGALNEDNSVFDDTDEVYAKLILENTFAGTRSARNSNQVSGKF